MNGEERVLRGVVRNGAIVLGPSATLPEGAEVTITIHPPTAPSEDEVTQLSEDAVREVDQWERQE